MRSLLLFLLFLVPSISLSAKAETPDPIVPALVLHGADYLQTLQISHSCHTDGKYHETNPILGECPSKAEVGKYFAATALAGLALHEILPERYKPYASYVWVAVEAGAVGHNAAIGIKLGF